MNTGSIQRNGDQFGIRRVIHRNIKLLDLERNFGSPSVAKSK